MFAADYDHLSPLGETQARRLGEYWVQRQIGFDAVYTGPRRRQQGTAQRVAGVFAHVGHAWPAPTVLDELDEYDNEGIMRVFEPWLVEHDATIRGLAQAAAAHATGPDRYPHYHRLFEAVVRAWAQGRVESPSVETWPHFRERVQRALRRILREQQGGRRVAVFTSGGPIAVAAQLATQAPEAMALEFHWRIRNASITELVFSGARVTLDTFNALPHLDDPNLWTYR